MRVHEVFAMRILILELQVPEVKSTIGRQAADALPRPTGLGWRQDLKHPLEIVQKADHDSAAGGAGAVKRPARSRLPQPREATVTRQERRKRDTQHRVRGEDVAADRPGASGRDDQPIAGPLNSRIDRDVDPPVSPGAIAEPMDPRRGRQNFYEI